MYKNPHESPEKAHGKPVSILVLMELCIKTQNKINFMGTKFSFNPCFNGTMYKNNHDAKWEENYHGVSILVLMELCIKTSLERN